jgi:hypothetical protein
VKAIELKGAKRRLSAYAKMAYDAPVLLTSAGKPYVVMARATEAELEGARYRAEGGLSTGEVRSRVRELRRAARRPAAVRKVRREAVARRSRA